MRIPVRPAALCIAVLTAAAVGVVAAPDPASSQEGPSAGDSKSLVTERSRKAVRDGLSWLVRNQQDDGSWLANVGFKLNDGYEIVQTMKPHVGVTALAGAAFLAAGSEPKRGPYARQVERALQFILSAQDKSGFIGKNETRMYSHAFATMFLAELYGMSPDERIRDALQLAVKFTYDSQNSMGGWRYVPNSEDSDMSLTVCQVVALRAAKNKGIAVPKDAIDSAVEYVLRSAVVRDDGEFERGAFLYQYRSKNKQAEQHTRTSFALTAAGLTTLYGAGIYTDQDIRAYKRNRPGLDIRDEDLPDFRSMHQYVERSYARIARSYPNHYYYWYGNYYAVQAMYIAGGDPWTRFFTRLRDDLCTRQGLDGSWQCDLIGPAYPTATAALCLQIPNNYLPIFQR